MNIDSPEVSSFMLRLYELAEGDTKAQVNSAEIGDAVGLDKGAASALAEDLMIEEWVELKTLSGGIGITSKGIEALTKKGFISAPSSSTYSLSSSLVVTDQDIENLHAALHDIKGVIATLTLEYSALEELVIDIKTIDTQLFSPKPKTAIFKQILRSIAASLETAGEQKISSQLFSMVKG